MKFISKLLSTLFLLLGVVSCSAVVVDPVRGQVGALAGVFLVLLALAVRPRE